VEPFVRRAQREGWIDGHFFIRYSELGPHLRLRLHGDGETLEGTVWPALQEHVRAVQPDVSFQAPEPPEQPQMRPFPEWTSEGGTGRITHAARIEYEPETDRYGGPAGVRLAEKFFEVSSDAAYALLKKTGAERSSRLGKGLLATAVLVHTFAKDRLHGREFAHQYGINYLRAMIRDDEARGAWLGAFGSGYEQQAATLVEYVEEVWSRLDEGESLSEALDAFAEGTRRVREEFRALLEAGELARGPEMPLETWEQAVASIVSSYIHMMNNRLGVTIQEESYLAYLIARTLGQPPEEAPAPAPAAEPAEAEAR
jgi:thiopeptide-type bacteriocin biosynthesis protein